MATRRPPHDPSSEEQEPTALDLRPPASRPSGRPRPDAKLVSRSVASHLPQDGTRADTVGDSDSNSDEEATEFLSVRPSSQSSAPMPALRARGRAVSLHPDDDAASQLRAPPHAPAPRTQAVLADEQPDNTEPPMAMAIDPSMSQPRIVRIPMKPQPTRYPDKGVGDVTDPTGGRAAAHRPLPARADQSAPVAPGGHAGGPNANALTTTTPAASAHNAAAALATATSPAFGAASTTSPMAASASAAQPFKREPTVPKDRGVSTTDQAASEAGDGTLVVEVPDGASVFVNGTEHGVGPRVKVVNLDRYAKHAVRIHATGFFPWSGTVTLEGRTAAKIRPGLKPR